MLLDTAVRTYRRDRNALGRAPCHHPACTVSFDSLRRLSLCGIVAACRGSTSHRQQAACLGPGCKPHTGCTQPIPAASLTQQGMTVWCQRSQAGSGRLAGAGCWRTVPLASSPCMRAPTSSSCTGSQTGGALEAAAVFDLQQCQLWALWLCALACFVIGPS